VKENKKERTLWEGEKREIMEMGRIK